MKAYSLSDLINRTMIGDESFYDCAEVDPIFNAKDNRIDELERALRSCRTVLELQRASVAQFSTATAEAIAEADKVLTV